MSWWLSIGSEPGCCAGCWGHSRKHDRWGPYLLGLPVWWETKIVHIDKSENCQGWQVHCKVLKMGDVMDNSFELGGQGQLTTEETVRLRSAWPGISCEKMRGLHYRQMKLQVQRPWGWTRLVCWRCRVDKTAGFRNPEGSGKGWHEWDRLQIIWSCMEQCLEVWISFQVQYEARVVVGGGVLKDAFDSGL